MDYKVVARNAFYDVLGDIPANGCEQVFGCDSVIIDAGLKTAGGWSSAGKLLNGLLGGCGTVGFGRQLIGEEQLPTVEMFFDAPVHAASMGFGGSEGVMGVMDADGERYALGIAVCQDRAEVKAKGNLVVTAPTSLLSSILYAATGVPRAIEALLKAGVDGENILWAWSTCPVAALSRDADEAAQRREKAMREHSSIHCWVRGDDSALQAIVNGFDAGRLYLHNMNTSSTLA